MASSYTTNKALEKSGYNDYINSWNVPTNSGWDITDACFGGTYSIALTNSNVTLTQTNCQNARIRMTGALSANIVIYFPAAVGGFFIVQNSTSGAYTITLASAGGGTYVTAGQSQSTFIFSDGTNIIYADDTRLQLNAGAGISISSGISPTITNTGVLSFNTRTGSVSLTSSDVTTALGYTPPTPTGTGASGTWGINITGTSTNITAYTINQSVGTANYPTFAGVLSTSDITTYRSATPTTGLIFFGNTGTRYLYYDASNYSFIGATGANLYINGYVVLNAANYNSYSPTITGGNASGTWGINITGNAATVTNGVYNTGGTYNINVTGNAATATTASTATTATNVSGGSVSATSGSFSSGLSVTGNITASGNVTAYSDAKIKKNIVTIHDALNKVKTMRGVLYTNINTDVDGVGVIAQEMLEVCPQVVQDNNGMLSVAYGNLVGVLIEAIKELSGKVAALESK
jgi:hypothetical protein